MNKRLFICSMILTATISNADSNQCDYCQLDAAAAEKSIMDKINNNERLKAILNTIQELARKIDKAYKEGKDESKYLFQFSEKIMQLQTDYRAQYALKSDDALLLGYTYQVYSKTGNKIIKPNDLGDFLSADFIKISSKLPGLFPPFSFRCTSNNIHRFFGE